MFLLTCDTVLTDGATKATIIQKSLIVILMRSYYYKTCYITIQLQHYLSRAISSLYSVERILYLTDYFC